MANIILKSIATTAKEHPQRLCFDGQEDVLTYAELERQSTNLAAYFTKEFSRTQPIVVCGSFSSEMLVTFVACLKAGHPYVPVDAHTPTERIKLILAEAKPACILAFENWDVELDHRLELTKFKQIVSEDQTVDSSNWVKQDELVYIIFTSGTTGKPKGVQINYNNLISFTDWMLADFELNENQRYLCQAPFSFDLSVMDLYPSLLTGGTLVPLAKEIADNFPMLFKTLPQLALNVWVSTPSLVEICLINPEFNQVELPDLTHFLFCGEELPHGVAEKLLNQFPQARVVNTYGPTEATVAVTEIAITSDVLTNNQRLPLGKVKGDTQILIFNEEDQPVGENQIGEIIVVGPSVSSGYLNQPEKTAEVFFTYEGQPAYRTGDAGYLKDGLLFYQGRLDFQIKWHGYRMELGDIDHHLLALEEVRNTCVVPKYKDNKVQQLIAYVVLNEGQPENVREKSKSLKSLLKAQVMEYMIPQKFVFVDQLPLSANGKIDRKQLINEVNP